MLIYIIRVHKTKIRWLTKRLHAHFVVKISRTIIAYLGPYRKREQLVENFLQAILGLAVILKKLNIFAHLKYFAVKIVMMSILNMKQ